jgi:hypothetical protein
LRCAFSGTRRGEREVEGGVTVKQQQQAAETEEEEERERPGERARCKAAFSAVECP